MGPAANHPQLISATLVLDRDFQPVRQVVRMRTSEGIRELRFVQTHYERKPSRLVPDAIFNPESELLPSSGSPRHSSAGQPHSLIGNNGAQLAELEISVLYQLHSLGADTGVPIEVFRTPDGHVRVTGTVAADAFKQSIATHLRGLAGQQFLELQLASARELRFSKSASAPVDAYEVTQPGFAADARIRSYFQERGFSGERLDAGVAQFSRDALQHAQRALQHAYALERLGGSLSAEELRSINLTAQMEWTEMVNSHAADLENELRSLQGQLAEIAPAGEETGFANPEKMRIADPEHFAKAAGVLLQQVRDLNRQVGAFFTASGKAAAPEQLDAALKTIMDTIPLRNAEELASFAVRLGGPEGHKKIAAQHP
jgi:hypothetical protein